MRPRHRHGWYPAWLTNMTTGIRVVDFSVDGRSGGWAPRGNLDRQVASTRCRVVGLARPPSAGTVASRHNGVKAPPGEYVVAEAVAALDATGTTKAIVGTGASPAVPRCFRAGASAAVRTRHTNPRLAWTGSPKPSARPEAFNKRHRLKREHDCRWPRDAATYHDQGWWPPGRRSGRRAALPVLGSRDGCPDLGRYRTLASAAA